MNRITFASYSASILIHLLGLLILPGIGPLEPIFKPAWIDVDILTLPELGMTYEPASGSADSRDASKPPDTLGNMEGSFAPNPPMNLPEILSGIQYETLTASNPQVAPNYGSVINDAIKELGTIFNREEDISTTGTVSSDAPPTFDWQPPRLFPHSQTQNISSEDMPLQGPVAKRKVIYRPPPPQPVATSGGMVSLKFWVHPDGTIGKIVPIRRADPELEKAAIEFLEKWRFEPLGQNSTDQWGILPIRFKLK